MSEPNKLYHRALTANRQLLAENARLKAEVERLKEDKRELEARLDFLEDPRG
jgi:hypothetical protein